MRLLELRGNNAADSKSAAMMQKPARKLDDAAAPLKKPTIGRVTPAAASLFPINHRPGEAVLRRKSIDIEQLQRRIDLLERRIQARLGKQGDIARKEDLETLRQRMKLLERKLETELWSAKQREYALLQMLAKPASKRTLQQRITSALPGIPAIVWRWIKAAGKEWWLDTQPLWWPRLSGAWAEAMARARR